MSETSTIPKGFGLLRCPVSGEALSLQGSGESGRLVARGSGRRYPIEDGIPTFVDDTVEAQTRRRFEYQWRRWGREERIFGKTPEEMRANLVSDRIGSSIDASFYPGKTVLDAGAGHGRYLRELAALGAKTIVGLDLGRGIGFDREGDPPSVLRVRGDLRHPPLAPQSFDLVFCDGVVHHTPDARQAVSALARLVRPGGYLYLWVYPRGSVLWESVHRAGRAVTTRLPNPVLGGLCTALVPLLSVVPTYSQTRLGRASWQQCAQVVWDWLSPPYQSHHSFEEVQGWLEAEGFEGCERLPVPTGIIARRPRGEM
ncbi:MAG: methyltransferase domain-containing protein [Planctomycetota bacterium]